MNQLIEKLRPVTDLPTWWLTHAINRTTRYTQTEKDEAMTYIQTITAGDLGEEQEEVEFVPLEQPAEAPVEPAVPAEPVPA